MIYRRYASLYFIIGVDNDEDVNELSFLEFIHNLVETLDKYFENVCELDVSLINNGLLSVVLSPFDNFVLLTLLFSAAIDNV